MTVKPGMSVVGLNPFLLGRANEALEERDGVGFMVLVGNERRVEHLFDNLHLLRDRGMYESALHETYTSQWTNPALRLPVPHHVWRFFFSIADRDRLRACGDPLPGPGPFTLYRGVSGRGKARRVKGFSWTGRQDVARWFAGLMAYGDGRNLPDPAVFVATVPESAVLFYTDGRNEEEYVIFPDGINPRRVEKVGRELFEKIARERRRS
ncbi:MAG: hypothetical protein Kow00128_20250 [Deltaproteobacteria bacterium]